MKTLLTTKTAQFKKEFDMLGYAQIKCHPPLLKAIQQITATWSGFCNQPLEHKLLLPYKNSRGYEYKDPEQDNTVFDYKENFHFRKGMILPAHFQSTEIDEIFLQAGEDLLAEMRPLISLVAYMASDITKIDFVKLAMDDTKWVARLLHYFGKLGGQQWKDKDLAEDHPDKAGFTFQVFESLPGLRGYWNKKWTTMQAKPGHILVFAGLLCQLYSEGKFKALVHDVEQTYMNSVLGRLAGVIFNDFVSKWVYDKENLGSTQLAFKRDDHYFMPHEQFSQCFRSVT